ncbi:M48 family metallopeptidase [Pseudomonas sp. S5(2021)]|jgi:predicted Zn-dependent protease|uniref:Peptidase M48 n=1 Tax=Stutzerimonas balearica DSM 6083 TaxID=1123016 RepID=A0A8D4C7J7_9GAMM|nr:M48 family metallopeptidase [Stutzerimonas balearica]MBZ5757820.1 M48 family metallopeptidase [Pseudomonas sp. S5(2021)]AJE16433.1 peptidase M48 [Stutzerimonas balearica DSM 6083]MBC7197957.1 M48 family metallopeptidase [Stutzerimonas balearica]QII99955.1 M48 family metalloprotease [Stutzerimonas balearica]WAN08937.1 M48 family metallopeptidase [Stutzerimonas balearica]
MPKRNILSVLVAASLMAGCQAVNTTSGGAVGVERKQYMFSMLSTEQVNQMYAQSYQETLSEAASKGALEKNSAISKRINAIAQRLIAQVGVFRPDAAQWDWDVNVIDSEELNANCGPGGKIIFYTGLVEKLNLTDDEIAAVMGHEIAHALREHGREAMSKAYGVQMATQLGSAFGVDAGSLQLANMGVEYLMTLPNSRSNENEADLIGLELAARAGYNPKAAISLWQKMASAGGSAPPEFMSTHPSSSSRIEALRNTVPKVMPLYEQARR